jgi:hypothetical protein
MRGFGPEFWSDISRMHLFADKFHYCPIFPFSNTILLRIIGRCQFMPNERKIIELGCSFADEFPPSIGANSLHSLTCVTKYLTHYLLKAS